MQALEFLRAGEKHKPQPVYALYGDDPFLKREAFGLIVRAALGSPDEEVARFAGDSAVLADVLDELRTLPFLAKVRVVYVEDADKFVTNYRSELEQYVQKPAETGVLVLALKIWNSATRLAKLVAKAGVAVECKSPGDAELAGWLTGEAKAHHATTLDTDAARLLVELVGPEAGLLISELEKLSVYVGLRARITRDDVLKMVGAGRVERVWKVLEAATTGKATEALADLDGLILSGEHPVGLLAQMAGSLKRVHHAGILRTKRKTAQEACREAGIPPFAIEATMRQHAHLGPARVERIPSLLLEADLDLKGNSQLPARVVLERLLLALARPREDPPSGGAGR